jgi:hypothetical protein
MIPISETRMRPRFVSYTRLRGVTLTRAEIAELDRTSAPNPPGFTGMRAGVHFYLGRRWDGPTNRVGARS